VWLQVGTANAAALYRSAGFVVADDALWEQRMDEQSRRYGVRRVVMRADLR
jgi:hypothetical protein